MLAVIDATKELPVTDAARTLDLGAVFAEADKATGELTTKAFMDLIVRIYDQTYDFARDLIFKLIELGRIQLTNRYTLIAK